MWVTSILPWVRAGQELEPLASLAIYRYQLSPMPSIADNRKKRGRGRPPTGIGNPVGLRLYPALEKQLDEWRKRQDDRPGRPEAIRRLLEQALRKDAKK
jgi:hypothetical protein